MDPGDGSDEMWQAIEKRRGYCCRHLPVVCEQCSDVREQLFAFGESSNVLTFGLNAETCSQACVRQFQHLFEIQDVIASFL